MVAGAMPRFEGRLQLTVALEGCVAAIRHLLFELTHPLLQGGVFACAAHDELLNRSASRHARHLFAIGDLQAAPRISLAKIGVVGAREDADHRRLAGAVVADHADSVAFVHAQ